MNPKILVIPIFCLIFCLQNEVEGQSVECGYTQYESVYACDLITAQANLNENITRIDGQHKTGRTDGDVKALRNIDDNKLKRFSSIFCQKFPNLEVVYMRKAGLVSIDEDSLSACKNLQTVFLTGLQTDDFSSYFSSEISKQDLKIESQLSTLPENLFLNQKKLEALALYGNQINFLPSNIFHSLVNLEYLDVDNNNLQSINPEWFVNLQNLKQLSLNANQILEVPSKAFKSLINLEGLAFFENKIKILHPDSFDGLQSVRNLVLDKNEISDLPADIFAPLTYLELLSLTNNNLTTIHSDSFGANKQLIKVSLVNNTINAIDEKFIDNTPVTVIEMKNNICSQSNIEGRHQIKQNLEKCIDNYLPRQFNISSCGKPIMAQGNVIGGTQIVQGSYPWIAALFQTGQKRAGKFICGGTIVSNMKVVTAAHCIQKKKIKIPFQANEIKVLLGVHDLNQQSEDGRVARDIQKIHMHPSWNVSSERYDADIAVLVLKTEVAFGSSIQPICLMEYSLAMAKITTSVVVGYGKSEDDTKEHENIPKILEVPIQKNEVCFLENNNLAEFSSARTFCGGTGNGTGVCSGDSGSGVVVNYQETYFLRGIVSSSLYRNFSCDVNTYAIFTDALKFTAWIEEIPVPSTEQQRLFNGLPIWD